MHHRNSIYDIYYKDECGFCTRARKKLRRMTENRKGKLREILITPTIQNRFTINLGQSTVPYIFCDDKFVGGAEDLDKLEMR